MSLQRRLSRLETKRTPQPSEGLIVVYDPAERPPLADAETERQELAAHVAKRREETGGRTPVVVMIPSNGRHERSRRTKASKATASEVSP